VDGWEVCFVIDAACK